MKYYTLDKLMEDMDNFFIKRMNRDFKGSAITTSTYLFEMYSPFSEITQYIVFRIILGSLFLKYSKNIFVAQLVVIKDAVDVFLICSHELSLDNEEITKVMEMAVFVKDNIRQLKIEYDPYAL